MCALHELWRYNSNSNHDQDHETEDNKTLEKRPLCESQSRPSGSTASGLNSSSNNKDSISQSDRTTINYYESYPNLGTTEIPGDVSPQSECCNKSTEGINESFARFENSRTSPISFSNNSSPSSPKLLQSKPSFSKPVSDSISQCDRTTISYYESYPNLGTTEIPGAVSPSSSNSPDSISQSDRTTICYYESYPNLGNTEIPGDVSPSSSNSSDSISQSDRTTICYYESYPNLGTTKIPGAVSPPSTNSSDSISQCDRITICYYESYPNLGSTKIPGAESPSSSNSSPCVPTSSSPNALPTSKPTLSQLHSNSTNQQRKANYIRVQNGTSPIYMIPKDIENMIKKDIVPDVLMKPLSPSTYKDYFAALLYAEDFYAEKWSDFQLYNVTLVLHEAAIYDKSLKNKSPEGKKDDKIFVAFEIDSVPEKQPFLLSRDFVYVRRAGFIAKEFQGIIYRVEKSTTVLVEFGKEFYSQHHADCKYDISFSFNRVCLKRAHQAIAAASDPLFQNYLFPDCASGKNVPSSAPHLYSDSANCQGQLPYLIEGPLCVIGDKLSKTGLVIQELVLKIYEKASKSQVLICAPINKTCDVLLGSLKKVIPESDIFRANAAFREVDGVPNDILPLCLYEGKCFSCPSLQELRQFRVIFSTFASSFRLHNEGISSGHFSHIFLLDASSATEPETMIALSNLANENTTVIVTGTPNNRPGWVRSDIATRNGLSKSYFERLRATKIYSSSNPKFFKQL